MGMDTALTIRTHDHRTAAERAVLDAVANPASRAIMRDVPGLLEAIGSHETVVTEHHGHVAWAASVGVEWPLHERAVLDSEAAVDWPAATAPTNAATRCGDERDGYVCNLPTHDPAKTDHTEVRWSSRIPRTAAFWNDGSGVTGLTDLVEVTP